MPNPDFNPMPEEFDDTMFEVSPNLFSSKSAFDILAGMGIAAMTAADVSEDVPYFYEDEWDQLYQTSKLLAEYGKENDVQDLVFVDRSARPMRVGIAEYWKLAYPEEKRPDMHFLNPELPQRTRFTTLFDGEYARGAEEFGRQLEESNSTLLDKKEQPIMLVDGCIHSGHTLGFMKAALAWNGFKNIHIGAFSDDGTSNVVRSNVHLKGRDAYNCRPFGLDGGLENTSKSIYTTPVSDPDPYGHARSMSLRREIRGIIRQSFAAEHS